MRNLDSHEWEVKWFHLQRGSKKFLRTLPVSRVSRHSSRSKTIVATWPGSKVIVELWQRQLERLAVQISSRMACLACSNASKQFSTTLVSAALMRQMSWQPATRAVQNSCGTHLCKWTCTTSTLAAKKTFWIRNWQMIYTVIKPVSKAIKTKVCSNTHLDAKRRLG